MDTLPTELLRRVAGYTSCSTHQSLSRVSRRIRAAVIDWAVYKAIVDNDAAEHHESNSESHNTEDTDVRESEATTENDHSDGGGQTDRQRVDPPEENKYGLWKWNPIASDIPTAICARYAWADHQARNLPPFERFTDENYIKQFIQWAGVLVARRHPFIAALSTRYLRGRSFSLDDYPATPTTLYTISFCRSAALLSAATTPYDTSLLRISPRTRVAADDPSLSIWWSGITTALHRADVFENNGMHRPFEGTSVPRTSHAIDSSFAPPAPENWMVERVLSAFSLHEVCVRTIGVIGYRVRGLMTCHGGGNPFANRFIGGPAWGDSGPDPRMIKPPPTAYEIPFASFMELPDPYADDAAAAFVWCHLRTMTTRTFIEDGPWMGVYTYRGMHEVDPLMVDVKFRVVDVPASSDDGGNSNSDVLDIAATGLDGIGDFTLYGRIYRATGKVVIKKTYSWEAQNGQTWDWLAFMTPFGIVGRWGDRFFGGYIWLWKEDWYGDT
ncbi:hypothetical protein TWF696_005483 [Orbilia brochopaga]|uniref:F-box domain-containing protein n=1 Tax=Orbilia brochopaga TaxID=3140254 RepID=A0AAV9V1V5_9PEZI